MDYNNTLLCDLTVTEFIGIFVGAICAVAIFWMLLKIIDLIFDVLFFLARKDKYHTRRDLLYIYALKDIARHRKQVRNAPSEKAFYLYYNRMLGAYESYVALGVFKGDVCSKLLDVRGVYVWKQESEDNKWIQE